MPLPTVSRLVPDLVQARLAVFVKDPEADTSIDPAVLSDLYCLTPTETEVARLLASGRSVAEIASRLRISTDTVRWHLKRVFNKTGSRNQADLVRVVLTSASGSPTHLRAR